MGLVSRIRNGSFRGFAYEAGGGGGSGGGDVTGKQTIFIPASAMRPRQTNGAAALAFLEIGASNVNYPFLGFDSSTDEYVQFITIMPKSWDLEAFTVRILWSRTTASGVFTVDWGVSCAAITTGGGLSVTLGTEVVVSSSASSADTGILTDESDEVTPSGTPSKDGTTVVFQIKRNTSTDALAVDARLHGLAILYNTDANNDD
jgi:hypothetical protein